MSNYCTQFIDRDAFKVFFPGWRYSAVAVSGNAARLHAPRRTAKNTKGVAPMLRPCTSVFRRQLSAAARSCPVGSERPLRKNTSRKPPEVIDGGRSEQRRRASKLFLHHNGALLRWQRVLFRVV